MTYIFSDISSRHLSYIVNDISSRHLSYIVSDISSRHLSYIVSDISSRHLSYIASDINSRHLSYIVSDIGSRHLSYIRDYFFTGVDQRRGSNSSANINLFKVETDTSHMTFKNIELNVVIIINYVCSTSYEVFCFLNFLHMICASSQIKPKYKLNTVISWQ
jgi:hypothetical protein